MILAGDIGGTNTRLAIFEHQLGSFEKRAEKTYPSRKYKTLDEIVALFAEESGLPIDRACFGIAGPVKDGRAVTPNLAWVVESKSLAKVLKLKRTHLLNDLESIAHGTGVLGPNDIAVVNAGNEVPGNRAVIAAGTGLGEAGLFWDGKSHHPMASEGGHSDFAARNELEIELLRFLIGKFGHVSVERVLSGPGLHNIYQFFRDAKKEEEPAWLATELKEKDPGAVITTHALSGKSPLCVHALDFLVELYGAEAGNCALNFMAIGGIFIAGGIAPRLLERFARPAFREAFVGKGRLKTLLETIPVKVVTNGQVGLLGAASYAASH